MVALKSSTEKEEKNKLLKFENQIFDMIDKVMEENDSSENLDSGQDEIDEESLKISRISKRHQTYDLPFQNFYERVNKKDLTEDLNNKEFLPNFNNTFQSLNYPLIRYASSDFSNNINNNYNISLNNFKNYLNNDNVHNNYINFNNDTNIPLAHSLTYNNQYNINQNININNFNRNTFPLLKTVVYNDQKNVFNNNSQNLFKCNTFEINNSQYNSNGNYNNKNTFFSSKINTERFKRREKRTKTYDIPMFSKNNINNYIKSLNRNSLNDKYLYNNMDIKNDINRNIIYPAKDSFIYEIKIILEKAGRIDYNVYKIIKGNFISIVKNHKGSKLFQKYLKSVNPEDIIHFLYLEVSQNLDEFITDGYSNYFCKKFFLVLSPNDRIDFLTKIENSIAKFSCDNIGTYPIQTIIENLNSNIEKFIIIKAIKDRIEELIYDPYGCHVLERLLSCIEEEYISFLYLYILDNFLKLANNCNGICLVKKILTFTNKKNLHEKIKQIVKENSYELIKHPYGNFVIQVIVECWNDYKEIINLYKSNFLNLSLEKYSSNVIERFIEKDEEILNEFIDEIIKSNRIYEIMKSNYGNYVIQKVIKLSKNNYKTKIVFCAAKDIENLIENKLILKWKSLLLPHLNILAFEQIQELKQRNYFEN